MTANPNPRAATSRLPALRVLIADDHDLLRDTLKLFLEGEGEFQTVTVASYSEAEALVQGGKFSTSCCSTIRCQA